jgi:hypothetical protein
MNDRKLRLFSVTTLRVWHAGISAFVAPMLLFFALSGSLQIFDLHEAHGTYVPSPLLSAIGRLHKDQILAPVPPKPPKPPQSPGMKSSAPPAPPPAGTAALKILFFIEAMGLVITTLIGIWVGVTHPKYARRTWILLGLGVVIPVILIVI